jgi:NAD(P)-dependent dehydrogenase (short-subunit alcohol dehydrogenase family)
MPLDFLGAVFFRGTNEIPYWEQIKKYTPPLIIATLIKLYSNGSSNTWERKLHGKVYIITGGTSGIGAALVHDLALKGAQLILLTSQIGENSDNSGKIWITNYIEDLREATNNEMIYAEYCDLSSLYSIRKFATKWLDNSPARRLDGIICLASESLPIGKLRTNSIDGVEIQMAINYLGHFHLLTLLEPALKVQPSDRDVRILVSSCLSQNLGEIDLNDLLWENKNYPINKPWKIYGSSKLLLNIFAKEFQRRLENFERPDKQPCGIRINIVNPGIVRSPSTRRFLSMGSIFGLIIYLIFYPIFWILFKSCEQGMQSFLFAINSPNLFNIKGGNYIKECSIIKNESRKELNDELLQNKIFEITKEKIEKLEKNSAIERNRGKKKSKDKVVDNDDDDIKSSNEKLKKVEKLEQDKIGLFKSAFANNEKNNFNSVVNDQIGLYPDLKRMNQNDKDKDKRLQRLDSKYAKSRKNGKDV